MTATIAHFVVRNEMNRWFPLTLRRARDQFDAVVVYDDGSTDGTFEFAQELGCDLVGRRGDRTPSFAQDEGACRQAAWEMMIDVMDLTPRDAVIVALDADEVVLGRGRDWTLDQVHDDYFSDGPVLAGDAGLAVRIVEVWGITEEGLPLTRVDGFWRNIAGWRIAIPDENNTLFAHGYACGSVPARFKRGGMRRQPVIYHLGYVHPDDRVTKHAAHKRQGRGHSNQHIDSILTPHTLEAVVDDLSIADLAFFAKAAEHAERDSWGGPD